MEMLKYLGLAGILVILGFVWLYFRRAEKENQVIYSRVAKEFGWAERPELADSRFRTFFGSKLERQLTTEDGDVETPFFCFFGVKNDQAFKVYSFSSAYDQAKDLIVEILDENNDFYGFSLEKREKNIFNRKFYPGTKKDKLEYELFNQTFDLFPSESGNSFYDLDITKLDNLIQASKQPPILLAADAKLNKLTLIYDGYDVLGSFLFKDKIASLIDKSFAINQIFKKNSVKFVKTN